MTSTTATKIAFPFFGGVLRRSSALVLIPGLIAASASAQTFTEDFSNDTLNDTPDNPPWNIQLDSAFGEYNVVEDTSDTFGAGTSNKILNFRDKDASGGLQLGATGVGSSDPIQNQQFVLAYDFFEKNESFTTPNDPFTLSFTESGESVTSPGSSGTVGGFDFNDGLINGSTTYTVATLHAFEVVVNNTSNPMNFNGDTVNNNSLSVYIDGSLAAGNIALSGPSSNDIGGFGFNSGGPDRGEFQVDNFTVTSVPEPGVTALVMGLFGLTLVALRRRKS